MPSQFSFFLTFTLYLIACGLLVCIKSQEASKDLEWVQKKDVNYPTEPLDFEVVERNSHE
jgi:hypothetical protein